MQNDEVVGKFYERIKELIVDAHMSHKAVALWGIGQRGKTICNSLELYTGIMFDYVVDANTEIVSTQTWVPQNKRNRHFTGDSYRFAL